MTTTTFYTLCDTTYCPSYEEYVEWCQLNDITPMSEESNEYYNYIYQTQADDWNDLLDNLKWSEEANNPCLITGVLGLWDGSHEIVPVECDNLIDAIKKCANKCDSIRVDMANGVINVYAIHHDGQNTFSIAKYNEGMIETYENLF